MNIAYYRKLVVLAGLGPLLMLGWDAWHNQLGANGVNNALHITGILSLVFLFLSLIITPLRAVTGWNSLVAYRRVLGLYGFAYAALHFGIYVLFDRMGSITATLDEIWSRRFLLVGFVAIMLMVPLALTSTNAMIRKLGPRRWKLLHRLAYVATALGVVHYYMLVKSDVRQPLAFAAVLTPILGFRSVKYYLDLRRAASKAESRIPAKPLAVRKFWNGELTVSDIHRETHDVKTFRFVHSDGHIPFNHLPGQYMNLTLSINGQTVKRSYTIASSPTHRGHVELTVKRNPKGLASRYMHDQLKIGDTIRISAPTGKFFFHDLQSKGVVLIAGGVGITPLMSILRYLTDHKWTGAIYFINAMRSSEDRIFLDEFISLASRFENLKILDYYSQSKPSQTGSDRTERWKDKSGYINAADLIAFVPNLNELPIFLCGPEPMMQAVRKAIASLGVPDKQISTEEFVSPRSTAIDDQPSSAAHLANAESFDSQTATITFAKSNQMIEVDASTTILEAAEQAGVNLPWECRSGICGQCKIRCSAGRVRMDSLEALSKGEEANGYILACQSHPDAEAVTIEA